MIETDICGGKVIETYIHTYIHRGKVIETEIQWESDRDRHTVGIETYRGR